MRKCQSEEADQRVIRHRLQCVCQQIYKQIVVRTIDTDILILPISHLGSFRSCDTSVFNVYAEMINNSMFYDMGKIIAFLGPDIWKTLPFFYAFTGCDIISSFCGKGKYEAWDTWMGSEHKNTYTDLFSRLRNKPESVSDNDLDIIGRFVVELYLPSEQNTSSYSLTSPRLENFVRSLDNDLRKLPPSREGLRPATLLKRDSGTGVFW